MILIAPLEPGAFMINRKSEANFKKFRSNFTKPVFTFLQFSNASWNVENSSLRTVPPSLLP